MRSIQILLTVLELFHVADARVTFPFSQIFQETDLVDGWGDTPSISFNCDDGCTVYADHATEDVRILSNGRLVATFTDIVGSEKTTLAGYQLPAGDKYQLQTTNKKGDLFAFYVSSAKAPNYGSSIVAPEIATVDGTERYYTLLTAQSVLRLTEFRGAFPAGYPKVYATGADTLNEMYGVASCKPVYEARSQQNAELTTLVLFGPIITVDFGFVGKHSFSVSTDDTKPTPKAVGASTVYTSPGYIGCPFAVNQLYSNARTSVQDEFTIFADSLDISANYNNIAGQNSVQLRVNQDIHDFWNTGSASTMSTKYDGGAFAVYLYGYAKGGSFAIQMDFGN